MLDYGYKTGSQINISIGEDEVAVLMDYYLNMGSNELNVGDVDTAINYLMCYSKLKRLINEVDNADQCE